MKLAVVMIKIGPNYDKLKTSLRLASHRLKILQTKKSEICEKLKLEVADNIKKGKFMKARVQAHRIAREDATVEAMELIEMYCDQILERYELFQEKRVPDVSLLIPIVSLIWVAPYYQSHVEELKVISKQMAVKYGSRFCRQALTNNCGVVRRELIERVKQFLPSDENIDNCLRKICSKHGIEYSKNKQIQIEDNLKDLSETIFKHDNAPSRNALKSVNGDIEYVTEGSGKTGNQISSKKAFMKMMNKFKSENINGFSKNKSEMSSDINFRKISTENLGGVTAKSLKDDEVSKIETRSNNPNYKCNEMATEKYVLAFNNSDINSAEVRNMYLDPPPPYNYHYLRENKIEEGLKIEKTLEKDFQNLQLPTCPDDDLN